MCGIAGICGTVASGMLEDKLKTMLLEMAHRGPDDQGVWICPDAHCGLAHKRLAIIDPVGGHEPLTNEDESIWLTFNGCIYNYLDIARVLRQKGHTFRTACDAEVIIHAYEQWGPQCVERFNGMWAFAIWDAKRKTLFCSRDRIGIKPFYYVWDGQTFSFASEIKALLAIGAVKPEADPEGLRHYLTFQFTLAQTSLFKGVQKLLPGHNLIFTPGSKPETTCYWDVSFEIDTEHNESYFIDRLNRLLEDAVRLRLRSDMPLGAHLSGGLDSTAVVCLTRLMLDDAEIKTFTGAFREGAGYDETPYARLASEAARTEHHQIYIGPELFAESMPKIIWHMDEPAGGPGVFPQYWVSKLASEHVKVALGGQGGDELFLGYARYLVAYLEECLKGAIEETSHRAQYVATLETIVPSLPSLQNYVPMLRSFWEGGLFETPAGRYFRLMNRFVDTQALLQPGVAVDHDKTYAEFQTLFDSHGAAAMINRITCFDLKAHLQALLHIEDRIAMAWGLESRVPLLDHRLIEFICSVPPVIKFKNGQLKWLFRQAIQNLIPWQILDRKDKMGFPVPLTQWLKTDLRDFTMDVLLGKGCRQRGIFNPKAVEKAISTDRPFSRSIWGALNLELWHQTFIDGGAYRPRAGST